METSRGQPVVAYFGHDTTMQLLFTSLGIAVQNIPLLANNFDEMSNRSWMTSKITPFATNLAAVRYDCPQAVKVQFLLNQQPLHLDECNKGLCDLQVLQDKYRRILQSDCNRFFSPEERQYTVELYGH